jgi:hypothetical protein
MKRHGRDNFFVVGEGILTFGRKGAKVVRPSTVAALRKFRFSRIGPQSEGLPEPLLAALATAMTAEGQQPESETPKVDAGFTYLGQFVDHDLTLDKTAVALGSEVTVDELVQGRSPALDLDSLYGRGPLREPQFYTDGIRLKTGKTAATSFPDGRTNAELDGLDLPRRGFGSTKAERRTALIPDTRNDENLVVAQTHLAFIRFHNRVVEELVSKGTPTALLFAESREMVVKHYQWMLRHDHLPLMVDPAIVDDVFTNGRKMFEVFVDPGNGTGTGNGHASKLLSRMRIGPGDTPTMPIEFSIAAYRFGHSMVRGAYQWNRVFNSGGPGPIATLELLFQFSGTSGTLDPGGDANDPNSGTFERLPSNWATDWRRLYDFGIAGRQDLVVEPGKGNIAKRVDTLLVDPLATLPLGSFGGQGTTPDAIHRNLAFRNLVRAGMANLATGQQMAELAQVPALSAEQIIAGAGGADLSGLSDADRDRLVAETPLWFYILREAELNGGRLTGVGGRIVAEVFHRAMEGSVCSIVRDPSWRPSLGPDNTTFRMVDLLLFAFEGKAELLNPLGD